MLVKLIEGLSESYDEEERFEFPTKSDAQNFIDEVVKSGFYAYRGVKPEKTKHGDWYVYYSTEHSRKNDNVISKIAIKHKGGTY